MEQHLENAKSIGDMASLSVAVAAFFDMLPHIAALLSVVWMVLRIWETDTIQKLVTKK